MPTTCLVPSLPSPLRRISNRGNAFWWIYLIKSHLMSVMWTLLLILLLLWSGMSTSGDISNLLLLVRWWWFNWGLTSAIEHSPGSQRRWGQSERSKSSTAVTLKVLLLLSSSCFTFISIIECACNSSLQPPPPPSSTNRWLWRSRGDYLEFRWGRFQLLCELDSPLSYDDMGAGWLATLMMSLLKRLLCLVQVPTAYRVHWEDVLA